MHARLMIALAAILIASLAPTASANYRPPVEWDIECVPAAREILCPPDDEVRREAYYLLGPLMVIVYGVVEDAAELGRDVNAYAGELTAWANDAPETAPGCLIEGEPMDPVPVYDPYDLVADVQLCHAP